MTGSSSPSLSDLEYLFDAIMSQLYKHLNEELTLEQMHDCVWELLVDFCFDD